jgi:hypothetical protein
MKIKQNYLKVGFLLTALTLLPIAQPAMAKDQVPFKGVEVGDITGVAFDFPFATLLQTAEGEASHLGQYTVTGIVVVDVTTGTATGTYTITAANGDMLFTTTIGHALQPLSLKETVDNVTVTGGTGRFENATGSWVKESHFAFVFGGPEITDPYVATLEGTISIRDKHRRHGDQEDDQEGHGDSGREEE